MNAQIIFLSLFLGIAAGPQPVTLQVIGPVRTVRLLLGGREVAALTSPPWRALIDFGAELTPRELTAIGFDEHGTEVARATQILNLPRPTAEIDIVLKGNDLSLRWRHLTNEPPNRALVTLDGKPLPVDPRLHATLPKLDRETPHVIAVEMRFVDGFVARREMVIESVRSDTAGAQLTPVLLRETAPDHPAAWEGCVMRANGGAVRVAAIEKPRALVIFVREPRVQEGEKALSVSARTGKRMTQLDRDTFGQTVWPVARRYDNGGESTSLLFPHTESIDLFDRGTLWLLTQHFGDDTEGTPRQFADAVAVAGVRAVTGSQRRAVVYLVGPGDDASRHRPEVVRRYLQTLGVPLFVWSLTGPRPDLTTTWGAADDVSSVDKLAAAVTRVRETLAEQRVAWVDVDPLTALELKVNERCGIASVARPPV